MELREFVKETLLQIIEGVSDAQQKAGSFVAGGDYDAPQPVAFDVAVTAVESKEKEGKAGLTVAGIGGSGSLQSASSNTTVNRIQFSIPIWMPKPK